MTVGIMANMTQTQVCEKQHGQEIMGLWRLDLVIMTKRIMPSPEMMMVYRQQKGMDLEIRMPVSRRMQGGQTVLWLKDSFSDRRRQMPLGERCTSYNKREQRCFQPAT